MNEQQGGLSMIDAKSFVTQALETFRWHSESTVSKQTYEQLSKVHPLVADVVCFKGPHINHLTPRVFDIDQCQKAMGSNRMKAKSVIEGPPKRECPVLLRQTSFLALEEPIKFLGTEPQNDTHTARFGEVEQRGCALTPKGRLLYDNILANLRAEVPFSTDTNAIEYDQLLRAHFSALPDDLATLCYRGLAYFTYSINADVLPMNLQHGVSAEELVEKGVLRIDPILYEDFLPVSAAGIFQSNLGSEGTASYSQRSNKTEFEAALGCATLSEFELYEAVQRRSLEACLALLGAQERRAERA
jgi:uncharacterized glyoxalase superfamily metalloenzyme YdcJ